MTAIDTPADSPNVPTVTDQPDGPGKRVGRKAEVTTIFPLLPGGAETLRARLPQLQHEAFVFEPQVGTVDNFRIIVIDDDTRVIATVVYDGDFQPYVADILTFAGPWLDRIFDGVVEGYPGAADAAGAAKFVLDNAYTASIFFHGNPEVSTRDVAKMQRLSAAVTEFLDAAS